MTSSSEKSSKCQLQCHLQSYALKNNTSANETIRDGRPLLAFDVITHCLHHNAMMTSGHTLMMSYLVPSLNGKESFNKFSSPDVHHLIGGPSHGYTPRINKIKSIRAIVFELCPPTDKQTRMHSPLGEMVHILWSVKYEWVIRATG